jgi:chain length determinant protein EpsF
MTFAQFFTIVKAHRWAMTAWILGTMALALAVSLVLPNQYTATSSVVVDMKSPDPILGVILGPGLGSGYMATQVDIITSDRVARKVVRDLGLTKDSVLREEWQSEASGRGDFEAWIAQLVQAKLDVKPARESNVINIAYTAQDPKFAAALSNAFSKAYIATNIELRVEPAKQYTNFFDVRSQELRTALEQAQTKLSEYQRQRGILVTDERLDVENQRLNELTTQLVAIQAITAESRSRSAQARASADQLQDVITNPVVAGLRADLSRQEAKLQELSASFGDAHPQVKELRANIAELRQKLTTETSRVSSSVGINNTIAASREAEVRASVEAQRARVSKMKEQRDEAAVLIKDVEAAQRAYDAVAQRLTQTTLESQATQTNISVLTPAVEPSAPSSPKVLRNTLVGILLGFLLAIAYALLREMTNRRVRSTQDLLELLQIPVLGTLPRPQGGKSAGNGALLLPQNVMARLPHSSR